MGLYQSEEEHVIWSIRWHIYSISTYSNTKYISLWLCCCLVHACNLYTVCVWVSSDRGGSCTNCAIFHFSQNYNKHQKVRSQPLYLAPFTLCLKEVCILQLTFPFFFIEIFFGFIFDSLCTCSRTANTTGCTPDLDCLDASALAPPSNRPLRVPKIASHSDINLPLIPFGMET